MDAEVTMIDIEIAHRAAIASMTGEQKLAMARELLANQIRHAAERQRKMVTRRESLEGVFTAEAVARRQGATPQVDFFLPLENELPTQGL